MSVAFGIVESGLFAESSVESSIGLSDSGSTLLPGFPVYLGDSGCIGRVASGTFGFSCIGVSGVPLGVSFSTFGISIGLSGTCGSIGTGTETFLVLWLRDKTLLGMSILSSQLYH